MLAIAFLPRSLGFMLTLAVNKFAMGNPKAIAFFLEGNDFGRQGKAIKLIFAL